MIFEALDGLRSIAVTQDDIVNGIRPAFDGAITAVRTAFADFDRYPPEIRLTVEDARPDFMSLRVLALWEQRWGTDGRRKIRIAKDRCGIKFLLIEYRDGCIGLRYKRLDENGLAYQTVSGNQTELRQTGSFPEFKTDTIHAILGVRWTHEVQPALINISISQETTTISGKYTKDWRRVIWDANEGAEPIRPIPREMLPTIPPAIVKPRSTGTEADRRKRRQGG